MCLCPLVRLLGYASCMCVGDVIRACVESYRAVRAGRGFHQGVELTWRLNCSIYVATPVKKNNYTNWNVYCVV